MIRTIQSFEVGAAISCDVCDRNSPQPRGQRFWSSVPGDPKMFGDILICSSITDNVNKLPRGDSERIENGGAQSLVAANLIITDISVWQFCARDVDHAWQHAQPAELFLGRSGWRFREIKWRHTRPNEIKLSHGSGRRKWQRVESH